MKRNTLMVLLVIAALLVVGCGAAVTGALLPSASEPAAAAAITQASYTSAAVAAPATSAALPTDSVVAALESAYEQVYAAVSPSVVTLEVVAQTTSASFSPFGQSAPQAQQGLGSGFVWDTKGDIVTNNHVVDGATQITVVFSDGSRAPAKVVGADAQSDLAVVKVDVAASKLKPVVMGDSATVKVGQISIAIGSPFGEEQTMTTGIISALGRTLPVDQTTQGPSYMIPSVIQTDTPINPGNSGGVLLDVQGNVLGVTAAIESSTRSNSGVGFAIPADVVKKVVPALIASGTYSHSYLGLSGTDLTPELASAMNLSQDQRGALVADVTANGPAATAGLRGSTGTATVSGSDRQVGGDVIIAIDGQTVTSFNDVVAYLATSTEVGQKVELTILRDGKSQKVEVTLGARPTAQVQAASGQTSPFQNSPNQGQTTGSASLGIQGLDMNSDLAQAMALPSNQSGVLIVSVQAASAAANANLRGGSQSVDINGQTVKVGGDVIIGMNGRSVSNLQGLRSLLSNARAGQRAVLTILRDGKQMNVTVTLGQAQTTP